MKHLRNVFFLLALGGLWLGCSNPADNVPAASVSEPEAKKTAGPASAGTWYSFGTNDSKIDFVGSKVTGKHDGGFSNFRGELLVVDGKLADTGTKVWIDTGSLWSDNDRLTGHLKSPDFFDAAQYPASTFVSTKIEQNGEIATVTGNLTLHGITKKITFPANVEVQPEEVTVTADFHINRFDFEMKYPGRADDLIRQEVVIKLKIKATPGRAEFPASFAAL